MIVGPIDAGATVSGVSGTRREWYKVGRRERCNVGRDI